MQFLNVAYLSLEALQNHGYSELTTLTMGLRTLLHTSSTRVTVDSGY